MPNRIIKESICTSDNIDQLSPFQETVFFRLIVNCDDFGRMDARPKILASKLFPLKRDIRESQIVEALRALTSAELVITYTVNGKPFLQMKTWERHQQIRAKKPKYPGPESGNTANENICNPLISDDSKCPRNPIRIQSESNPNPNDGARATEERFTRFWAAYPRKEGKKDAKKAFLRLKPDDALLQTMLAAIEKFRKCAQWTDEGGRFIPHPATWLNGCRWEDEIPKAPQNAKAHVSEQAYTQRDYTEAELLAASDDLMAEARTYRDENRRAEHGDHPGNDIPLG